MHIPGRLQRWVLQSSRWVCRGQTANRNQGSHNPEDQGPLPSLHTNTHKKKKIHNEIYVNSISFIFFFNPFPPWFCFSCSHRSILLYSFWGNAADQGDTQQFSHFPKKLFNMCTECDILHNFQLSLIPVICYCSLNPLVPFDFSLLFYLFLKLLHVSIQIPIK